METYLHQLPRVIHHVSILLQDRDFPVPSLYSSLKDISTILSKALEKACSIGELLTCVVTRASDNVRMKVAWIDPTFDVSKGRDVMTSACQLYGTGLEEPLTLILSYTRLSPDATKEASKLKHVQILTFNCLAIPISQHIMIPAHTALTEQETQKWEMSTGVHRSQMPILKMSDPVRKWYGWPKNTLVRIDRSMGETFRYVK